MKIIDEKGRLFRFINLIDLVAIIAVIAVIAGLAWTFIGDAVSESLTPEVEMTVTMRIRGNFEYIYNELVKSDKRLISGSEYVDGAYIESVELQDYYAIVTTDDGEVLSSLDPVKKDTVVVVKAMSTPTTATPKIGTQEVRAGKSFVLKTQTVEIYALIESVVFDDESAS